ncbi:MAG TPA: 16S rRNA (cytidine(1402)-2'-O)-methyltransferase [Burkholderiales bacterium]|nr:16S rRNA (cytidine(1402)-2'-O)-methyltransferase [Burkholderiales bacterium]
MQSPGSLYVVATPIGNLSDITQRALEVLKWVDLIAAEDTRHSGQLLARLGISARFTALHEHNESHASMHLVSELLAGKNIALISDAGTPAISDPGTLLIAAAHDASIRVIPVPGPSAVICALSAAGIAAPNWLFYGFLPAKSGHRRNTLQTLATLPYTLIFYEAPHRIVECVADLAEILGGERRITFARELTKLFESIHSLPLAEAAAWLGADTNRQKGEFVLIVGGAAAGDKTDDHAGLRNTLSVLMDELPLRQAVHIAAKLTGVKKNTCYKLALTLQKTDS